MSRRCARLAAAVALSAASCAACAQVGCTVSAAPLNFGAYDALSPVETTVNGGITLDCTLLSPGGAGRVSYRIALSQGSGSFAQRRMPRAGGGDELSYNAYWQSVSAARVWGSGAPGTVVASGSVSVPRNGRSLTEPMIGVIPALQPVGAGTYTDTLIVTVTYD